MVEPESTLGERIHRMQVEDRLADAKKISEATGLGELSVWPYYAGFALVEIERLRAENKQLRESGAMLIKTIDHLAPEVGQAVAEARKLKRENKRCSLR